MTVTSGSILSDALLQGCRQRAAGYDRDNKFCQEDFDELKAAGYLKLTLPQEFGGQGYTLNQYTREARRLANYAPGDRALPQHAPLLGRHRRRQLARGRQVGRVHPRGRGQGRSVRRRPRRERQRDVDRDVDHQGREGATAATSSPDGSRSAA